MGYFPVDVESVNYLRATGRTEEQCAAFENYFRAQKMFGMPRKGDIDYSVDLELDLSVVQPSVAGPKRPQDRINLPELGETFRSLLEKPVNDGGYGKRNGDLGEQHLVNLNGTPPTRRTTWSRPTEEPRPGIEPGEEHNKVEMVTNRPTPDSAKELKSQTADPFHHGAEPDRPRQRLDRGDHQLHEHEQPERDAGRRFAGEESGRARTASRSGSQDLARAGFARRVRLSRQRPDCRTYLDQLGFNIVGYGCTTCIGNSGPLHPKIEKAISEFDLVAASVLSGNRNFEARVHQNIKANFLMSPPLVVAFALAGRVDLDLSQRTDRERTKTGRHFSARSLAEPAGNSRRDAIRAYAGSFPQTLPRLRRSKSEMERDPVEHGRSLSMGREERLHSRAAVLQRFLDDARARSRKSAGAAPSGFSAIRSRPITFRRPARSKPASPAGSIFDVARNSTRRISTATGAGAATIWS